MKHTYSLLLVALTAWSVNHSSAQEYGQFEWVKAYPDADRLEYKSFTLGENGNFYIAGVFEGTVSFDGRDYTASTDQEDGFILKLDANHEFLWFKHIYSTRQDIINHIHWNKASRQLLLSGNFTHDLNADFKPFIQGENNQPRQFIASLDSSGELIWSRILGRGGIITYPLRIISDDLGNAYVAAPLYDKDTLDGIVMEPNLEEQHFVAKIDPTGKFLWAHYINGVHEIRTLTVGTNNDLYIAGNFRDKMVLSDTVFETQNLLGDAFLLRLNTTDGSTDWERRLTSDTYSDIFQVVMAPDGQLRLSGHFRSNVKLGQLTINAGEDRQRILIGSVDEAGTFGWVREVPSTHGTNLGLAVDPKNNTYICGQYGTYLAIDNDTLTSNEHYESFLIKFSETGTYRWSLQAESAMYGRFSAIHAQDEDAIYLVGKHNGITKFGDYEVRPTNQHLVHLTKIETVPFASSRKVPDQDVLKVFPNPTSGEFRIDNLPKDLINIKVRNIQGKEVQTWPEPQQTYAVNQLPAGVYFITVTSGLNQSTVRLIIE